MTRGPFPTYEFGAHPACDTKVERREKLKESRKILAYPYCKAAQ
jgi:hypothetical protein